MHRALHERNVGAVFRLLTERHGVSQRWIAGAVGMSQSEVSEIVKGRRVRMVDVLERVCDGLGIDRHLMRLAGYADPDEPDSQEVTDDMRRRDLLALASAAVVGRPVLGDLLTGAPSPPPPALPEQVGVADVAALRDVLLVLRQHVRAYGGGADVLSPVAQRADALTTVPTDSNTRPRLLSTLGELNTLAGWSAHDSGQPDLAHVHYRQAVRYAQQSGDPDAVAHALWTCGAADIDSGHPNHGLKMTQLASVRDTWYRPWVAAEQGTALGMLGDRDGVRSAVARSRDQDPGTPDARADLDWQTAETAVALGELETAERLLTTALRTWTPQAAQRRVALAQISLADVHRRTGEPDADALTDRARRTVAGLRSHRARERLAALSA